jgi:hypothetical protein
MSKDLSLLDSNNINSEIHNVCSRCGRAANIATCLKKYGNAPFKVQFDVSTWHVAPCDFCGEIGSVTEVRDFFYPDFSLILDQIPPSELKTHGEEDADFSGASDPEGGIDPEGR